MGIRLHGDVDKAREYIGLAIQEMYKLKIYMGFNNLLSYRRFFENEQGAKIETSVSVNIEQTDIFVPIKKVVKKEELLVWEPWNGSQEDLCLNHTWRVGMTDPNLQRHDYGICDGSFTLDPPVFHPSYPDVPAHTVKVTDLYWLLVGGGALSSAFWKEPAGSYAGHGYVNYRSSYAEWQASLDTVNGTLHEGFRNLRFDLITAFEGFQEGDFLPNTSFIAVELTDVNSNFVRLYFKADPAYLTAIGQSAYLIGSGIVDVVFSDWGLDSDLARMLIITYSDFLWEEGNYDRKTSYQCNSINFY